MKRTAKVIGTLSIALVMTSTITPAMVSADGGTVVPVLISAEGDTLAPEKIAYEANKEEFDFVMFEGIIEEVRLGNKYPSILVKSESEEGLNEIVFNISDDLFIIDQASKGGFDKNELKEGLKVKVFYGKNNPMTLSLPPITNPELIVVESDKEVGSIKHSKFNEELISLDNSLKLNISDETSIINQHGKNLSKEELGNKDLIVFYSITTRSIPAQTSPEKVIVLESKGNDSEEVEINEVDEIINGDSYYKDEVQMIPLRKVAEHLGYKLEWNNETRSTILTKGNSSFSISIGKQEYGYNKSLRRFETAPEIKDNNTYVPNSLLELLK